MTSSLNAKTLRPRRRARLSMSLAAGSGCFRYSAAEASSDEAASPEEELGEVARVLATEALLLLERCNMPNSIADGDSTAKSPNATACVD